MVKEGKRAEEEGRTGRERGLNPGAMEAEEGASLAGEERVWQRQWGKLL